MHAACSMGANTPCTCARTVSSEDAHASAAACLPSLNRATTHLQEPAHRLANGHRKQARDLPPRKLSREHGNVRGLRASACSSSSSVTAMSTTAGAAQPPSSRNIKTADVAAAHLRQRGQNVARVPPHKGDGHCQRDVHGEATLHEEANPWKISSTEGLRGST